MTHSPYKIPDFRVCTIGDSPSVVRESPSVSIGLLTYAVNIKVYTIHDTSWFRPIIQLTLLATNVRWGPLSSTTNVS